MESTAKTATVERVQRNDLDAACAHTFGLMDTCDAHGGDDIVDLYTRLSGRIGPVELKRLLDDFEKLLARTRAGILWATTCTANITRRGLGWRRTGSASVESMSEHPIGAAIAAEARRPVS